MVENSNGSLDVSKQFSVNVSQFSQTEVRVKKLMKCVFVVNKFFQDKARAFQFCLDFLFYISPRFSISSNNDVSKKNRWGHFTFWFIFSKTRKHPTQYLLSTISSEFVWAFYWSNFNDWESIDQIFVSSGPRVHFELNEFDTHKSMMNCPHTM